MRIAVVGNIVDEAIDYIHSQAPLLFAFQERIGIGDLMSFEIETVAVIVQFHDDAVALLDEIHPQAKTFVSGFFLQVFAPRNCVRYYWNMPRPPTFRVARY